MVKDKSDVYNMTVLEMTSEFRLVTFVSLPLRSLTWVMCHIDNAVCELQTKPQLKYEYHICGGFDVSVTADFLSVYIR